MDAPMDDFTLEELAELRYQEFLINEDRIMAQLVWEELKLEIGESILATPLVGRFVRWLASKLDRYSWLR